MAKKCSKGGARMREFSVTNFVMILRLRRFKSVRAGTKFWISDILCVFSYGFHKMCSTFRSYLFESLCACKKGPKIVIFWLKLGVIMHLIFFAHAQFLFPVQELTFCFWHRSFLPMQKMYTYTGFIIRILVRKLWYAIGSHNLIGAVLHIFGNCLAPP